MTAAENKGSLVLLDHKKPNSGGNSPLGIFRCCLPYREAASTVDDDDDDSTLASSIAPIMSITYSKPSSTKREISAVQKREEQSIERSEEDSEDDDEEFHSADEDNPIPNMEPTTNGQNDKNNTSSTGGDAMTIMESSTNNTSPPAPPRMTGVVLEFWKMIFSLFLFDYMYKKKKTSGPKLLQNDNKSNNRNGEQM